MADGIDQLRRLYRSVLEWCRRLGDASSRDSPTVSSVEAEIARHKLHQLCERAIFQMPLCTITAGGTDYARKAEDVLWCKVNYARVQRFKPHVATATKNEISGLRRHLMAAQGHYQRMLFRLQVEFRLVLEGDVDFAVDSRTPFSMDELLGNRGSVSLDETTSKWARSTAYRFVMCLGDLSRYMYDLCDDHGAWKLAAKGYYSQALSLNPRSGMPHNQLGTMAALSNCGVDALFHYILCIVSEEPFEGASSNLTSHFERVERSADAATSVSPVQHFYRRCVFLAKRFVVGTSADEATALSEEVLSLLSLFMFAPKAANITISNRPTHEVIFKLVIIFTVCAHRLENKDCPLKLKRCANTFIRDLYARLLTVFLRHLSDILCASVANAKPSKRLSTSSSTAAVVNKGDAIESETKVVEAKKAPSNLANESKQKKPKKVRNIRRLRRRRVLSTSQDDMSAFSDNSDSDKLSLRGSLSVSSNDDSSEEEEEITFSGEEDVNGEGESHEESDLDEKVQNEKKLYGDCEKISADKESNSNVDKEAINGKNEVDSEEEILRKLSDLSVGVLKLREGVGAKEILLAFSQPEGAVLKVFSDWLIAAGHVDESHAANLAVFANFLEECQQVIGKTTDSTLEHCRRALGVDDLISGPEVGWKQPFPLPEDLLLREVPVFKRAQEKMSFEHTDRNLFSTKGQQGYLRLQCLLHFVRSLSRQKNSPLIQQNAVDANHAVYTVRVGTGGDTCNNSISNDNNEADASIKADEGVERKQLMRSMAHLWLQQEVRQLQSDLSSRDASLSAPFWVADTSVLLYRLQALRQANTNCRFQCVIVIPTVVMQRLDLLKKESPQARDGIRWLESETRRGSRFVRLQRPHERLQLPLVTYPRRGKDRDAWELYQILECCHHFTKLFAPSGGHDSSATTNGAADDDTNKERNSMVTFLIATPNSLPANTSSVVHTLGFSMKNVDVVIPKRAGGGGGGHGRNRQHQRHHYTAATTTTTKGHG